MAKSLSQIIENLKELEKIKSNASNFSFLVSANKYFFSDNWKAYLLGFFFKNFCSLDNLPPKSKRQIVQLIDEKNLGNYFSLRNKPEKDSLDILYLVLFFGGFIPIIVGIAQLLNGKIWYGNHSLYNIPVVREGGFKIIVGLGLSIAGGFQLYFGKKRSNFLKSYSID